MLSQKSRQGQAARQAADSLVQRLLDRRPVFSARLDNRSAAGSGPSAGGLKMGLRPAQDLFFREPRGQSVILSVSSATANTMLKITDRPLGMGYMGVVFSEGAQLGIFVTYGTYSEPARDFARNNPLTLIDGKELMAMIRSVQSNPSPETAMAGRSTPRAAAAVPSTPVCPLCGSPMLRRTAKRGANAGAQFWGCPRYPGCRGTRP